MPAPGANPHPRQRFGGGWAAARLAELGGTAGSEAMEEAAVAANRHPPQLRTHDRFGHRQDVVEFHPAYHTLMAAGIEGHVTSLPWRPENRGRAGAFVARSAMSFMLYQTEAGTQCPQTMSFAAVPALDACLTEAQRGRCDWVAKLTSGVYDPRNVPATDKAGITVGWVLMGRLSWGSRAH